MIFHTLHPYNSRYTICNSPSTSYIAQFFSRCTRAAIDKIEGEGEKDSYEPLRYRYIVRARFLLFHLISPSYRTSGELLRVRTHPRSRFRLRNFAQTSSRVCDAHVYIRASIMREGELAFYADNNPAAKLKNLLIRTLRYMRTRALLWRINNTQDRRALRREKKTSRMWK